MVKRQAHSLLISLQLLLCFLTGAAVAYDGRKLAVSPIGNSITGSFNNKASYRYYLWRTLVDSGFAVKGEEKVDFTGYYCGVDDQNLAGECGAPKYDSTLWDWDHDGLHATPTAQLKTICRQSAQHAEDLGYPGNHIALIHHGTNDVVGVQYSIPQAKINVAVAIDTLRNHNPNIIILLCQIIPALNPYGTPIEDRIADHNQNMADLATEKDLANSPIYLVDQFTGYNVNADNGADGIHPVNSGEVKIGARFADTLVPILREIADPPTIEMVGTGPIRVSRWVGQTITAVVHSNVTSVYPNRGVAKVAFHANGAEIGEGTAVDDSTYQFEWHAADSGVFALTATVTDYCHRSVDSDTLVAIVPKSNYVLTLRPNHIQGDSSESRYRMQVVRVNGVVTVFDPADSTTFWIQHVDDFYLGSSDAVMVRTNGYTNPAIAKPAVGNLVRVDGVVIEDRHAALEMPVTCISAVDSVKVVSAGNIQFFPSTLSKVWGGDCGEPDEAMRYFERYEGMQVQLDEGIVIGPTCNRRCVALVNGNWRMGSGYRGDGRLFIDSCSGSVELDYNAERLAIEFSPRAPRNLRIGDTLQSVAGTMDYRDGMYVVLAKPNSVQVRAKPAPVPPVSERRYQEWGEKAQVTSINLGGLFDTLDNPNTADIVLTPDEYHTRMVKVTKAIISEMLKPSIVAVQGVEDSTILADLASRVNERENTGYRAVVKGSTHHPRGLHCGFLWDTLAYELQEVYVMSGDSVDSAFGDLSANPGCAPLVGRFFRDPYFYMTVINVHLVDNSTDDPLLGVNVPARRDSETQRRTQAQLIRRFLNGYADQSSPRHKRVLVLGEFNDLSVDEDDDEAGVNPVSLIEGSEAAGDVVFSRLEDQILPVWNARFSRNDAGNSLLTTHALVSPGLEPWIGPVDMLHFNAPYPDSFESDTTNGIRCAPFDALEIRW